MRALLFVTLLLAACQATTATPAATASPEQRAEGVSPTPTTQVAAVPQPTGTPPLPRGTLTIAGHAVAVDIADTYESRRQGLSGRPSLAADTGLVLAWDAPETASIWMPDMNFAIDVIFVRNARVVAVFPDAQPCVPGGPCPTFGPPSPVDYVLEVPAGSAKAWGVRVDSPSLLTRER